MYLIDNGELTTESLFILAIERKTGEKIYWDFENFKYEKNKCIKVEESFDEKSIQFIDTKLVETAKK